MGHSAQVLLVAHASRWAELVSLLAALEQEGVRFHQVLPEEVPVVTHAWEVVVIDGESLVDARQRRALLRALAREPRSATVLFVCGRRPSQGEIEDATALADDHIRAGWEAKQLCRRVRALALAPLRRARAARQAVEQLGAARLRVLPGGRDAEAGPGPASASSRSSARRLAPRPLASPELVEEVFRQGRRVEAAHIRAEAERICEGVLREVAEAEANVSTETLADIEDTFRGLESPVAAARFGGARAAVLALRAELSRYLRDEQASIERHQVRWTDREG